MVHEGLVDGGVVWFSLETERTMFLKVLLDMPLLLLIHLNNVTGTNLLSKEYRIVQKLSMILRVCTITQIYIRPSCMA